MKFKQYLETLSDKQGFFATSELRWVIRKNPSKTAREEAIAASIIKQANPRENISGHFPWGPEEQMVLQQLWIHPDAESLRDLRPEWRDVPIHGADHLFSTVQTEHGPLNVPEAIREPGTVRADFTDRIKEALGEDY